MKTTKANIPAYRLDKFRPIHRMEETTSSFGYNNKAVITPIPGFELYSSEGLIKSLGPLRSAFYRMSITISGTLDMQVGLETFQHQPRTLAFTYPNQVFSKTNISSDTFGYYLLFDAAFLEEIVPAVKMGTEFPFYDHQGTPVFQVTEEELNNIVTLLYKVNEELHQPKVNNAKAIKMYLYLLLLEARRSYERQQLHYAVNGTDHHSLTTRFYKLVSQHFLSKRQVTDYASLLAITPNHLNKVIKETTGETASNTIREMLVREAKALLGYTEQTIAEIAWQLDFSDPSSFNRFFKKATGETPLAYRNKA